MKWRQKTGTKPSGKAQTTGSLQDKCLFLLSEFTTAPVILHSGGVFYRQENVPSTAVREGLQWGWRHLRQVHPFQAWSHSYHTRVRLPKFSWNISPVWFYGLNEENKGGYLGGSILFPWYPPMVWLSFMTSAMSHCLAPPSHYSSSGDSSAAVRMEQRDAHTTQAQEALAVPNCHWSLHSVHQC